MKRNIEHLKRTGNSSFSLSPPVRENASACFVTTSFHNLKGPICSAITTQNTRSSVPTFRKVESWGRKSWRDSNRTELLKKTYSTLIRVKERQRHPVMISKHAVCYLLLWAVSNVCFVVAVKIINHSYCTVHYAFHSLVTYYYYPYSQMHNGFREERSVFGLWLLQKYFFVNVAPD